MAPQPPLPPTIDDAWIALLAKAPIPIVHPLEQLLRFIYLQGIQYALDRLVPTVNRREDVKAYTSLMIELFEETPIPEE